MAPARFRRCGPPEPPGLSGATEAIERFYVDRAAERSPESASCWDRAGRSSEHLDIVVGRYLATSKELSEATHGLAPLGGKAIDSADWDRMMEVGEVLEVDVISFFVFASIMLDMIARAVPAFGGPARNVGVNSHHDLVKDFRRYAELRRFVAPDPKLMALAQDLYDRVTESRNKVFVHPDTWRQSLGGFGIGPDGLGTIGVSFAGPMDSQAGKTALERSKHLLTPVPAFVEKLDEFVEELVTYLAAQTVDAKG